MADRGMTAAQITEIQGQKLEVINFIEIGLDTPFYMSNGRKDITHDSKTYLAASHFLKFSNIKETFVLKTGTVNATLSGVNQAFIAVFLSNDITNRPFTLSIGFLDPSGELIDDPVQLFSGLIEKFKLQENYKNGTSEINVSIANHWYDYERVGGRAANNKDQQQYYPDDVGFDHAAKIVKEIKWGQT